MYDFRQKLEILDVVYPVTGRGIDYDDNIALELDYNVSLNTSRFGIESMAFIPDVVTGSCFITANNDISATDQKSLIDKGFESKDNTLIKSYNIQEFEIIWKYEFTMDQMQPLFASIDLRKKNVTIR